MTGLGVATAVKVHSFRDKASVSGNHLSYVFLVSQTPLSLLVDWTGEEIFFRLGKRAGRACGRRRVAEQRTRGGRHVRISEQLVCVVSKRLSHMVLELRYISTIPEEYIRERAKCEG